MAAVGTSNGWFASNQRDREQRLDEREQRLGGMDGTLLHLAERIQEYTVDYAQTKVVSKLADEYDFDYQEAIRFLNGKRTVPKEVKVTKTIVQAKPTQEAPEQVKASKPAAIPLPFDPTRVVVAELGGCQGLRTNHGLYTQCRNEPAPNAAELGKNHIYCKVCLKQADKNSHGKPTAGTVADRLTCKDLMAYTTPDGKHVLSYGKVCQLLSIDQDRAVAEAYKSGITIPDEQWVIKQRKGKGKKSPKTAAVTDSSSESETDESTSTVKKQKKQRKYKTKTPDTDSELIAELVKQTSTTEIPVLLVEVGEELNEMCTAAPTPTPAPAPSPTSTKKVKKEKKKKDPNAPKRAPSAYNLFIQDKTNRAKYPEASAKDIMSKLSADWKALSETDNETWKNKAIARKAQMASMAAPPIVETPLPTPTPIVETPLPTPTPIVETPLPAHIVDGFEHVKKDCPELELDEYIGTCVTDGEETDDEEDVVIETLIHKGVTYYKDSEGLVYDGDDTQVGVWDPATEDVEFLYG